MESKKGAGVEAGDGVGGQGKMPRAYHRVVQSKAGLASACQAIELTEAKTWLIQFHTTGCSRHLIFFITLL